jgi:hypothetical protein
MMRDNIRGKVVASGLGAPTGFAPRTAELSCSAHGAAIVANPR